MDLYTNLEKLCKFLEKELDTANKKLEDAGRLSGDDLSYIDKLSHSIKSVKTTMAMLESGMSGNYGNNSGNYGNNSGRYSGNYGNNSGRYSDGGSYGRGRYAQRDSMGRYSGNGQVEDIITQLQEVMQDAPDDMTRREYEKVISTLERM